MSFKPERIGVIGTCTAEMLMPERLLLYSLIASIQPARCLEIGSHTGGSAMIITAAMEDVGLGCLVCVDPDPQIPPKILKDISPRAVVIKGYSPDALPQASQAANGRFQFAFIDGDHSKSQVIKDIEGLLPWLDDSAYLLLHDVHFAEVNAGIDVAVHKNSNCLTDCGLLSVEKSRDVAGNLWGGLRALRFSYRQSSAGPHSSDVSLQRQQIS